MSWTHTKISCCGYLRVESAKLVSCANICPTTGVTSCIWSKTQKLFRLQTCQFPQDVFLQGLRLLYCFSRHTFFHKNPLLCDQIRTHNPRMGRRGPRPPVLMWMCPREHRSAQLPSFTACDIWKSKKHQIVFYITYLISLSHPLFR